MRWLIVVLWVAVAGTAVGDDYPINKCRYSWGANTFFSEAAGDAITSPSTGFGFVAGNISYSFGWWDERYVSVYVTLNIPTVVFNPARLTLKSQDRADSLYIEAQPFYVSQFNPYNNWTDTQMYVLHSDPRLRFVETNRFLVPRKYVEVDFKGWVDYEAYYARCWRKVDAADLDADGDVDFNDFLIFSQQFGNTQ